MTGNQMLVFEVEAYLEENFEFRRNVVSGKTEYRAINCEEWTILTEEALNSIVREAKKHGIGDDKSPRQDINEYVMSNAVKRYSPVCDFLDTLPKWDGQNHIAGLFNRIPGRQKPWVGVPCGFGRWWRTGCRWTANTATRLSLCLSAGKVAARARSLSDFCQRASEAIISTTSTSATSSTARWLSPTTFLSTSTSLPIWVCRNRAS